MIDADAGTPEAATAARNTGRRWRWGCAVVLALPILPIGLETLYIATRSDLAITDADRPVLFYAPPLASRGFRFDDWGQYEDTEKERRFFGRLYRLEYEFHPPKTSVPFLDIYETVYIVHWPLPVDWVMAVHDWQVLRAYDDEDTDMVRNDDFFRYGDTSTFYDILDDGRKVGHYLHTRIGDRTLALGVVGIPCDTPEAWIDLVGPQLTYFETYRPEQGDAN